MNGCGAADAVDFGISSVFGISSHRTLRRPKRNFGGKSNTASFVKSVLEQTRIERFMMDN